MTLTSPEMEALVVRVLKETKEPPIHLKDLLQQIAQVAMEGELPFTLAMTSALFSLLEERVELLISSKKPTKYRKASFELPDGSMILVVYKEGGTGVTCDLNVGKARRWRTSETRRKQLWALLESQARAAQR